MATITSLGFNITSKWDGHGVREARNDLDRLQADMRRVSGASLHISVLMDSEAARAQLAEIRGMADDIDIGFGMDETSYADAEARIAALTRDRTVDIRFDNHNLDRELVSITNNFNEVSRAANTAGESGSHMGRLMKIAIAGFIGSLVALPGLINLVSAALMGGLAGAIVAVGAISLRNDEQIRASWSRLATDAGTIFKEAAGPMRQPFVDALDAIRERLNQIRPAINDAFASGAPLIRPMTDAILDLVTNSLPGMNDALRNMGPVVDGIHRGMANFGTSISNMFRALSTEAGSFGMMWNVTLTHIGIMMENFGVASAQMAQSGTFMWGELLAGLNGFIKGMLDGFVQFSNITGGPLGTFIHAVGDGLGDAFRKAMPGLAELVAALSNMLAPVMRELGGGVGEALGNVFRMLADALNFIAPAVQAVIKGFIWVNDTFPGLVPIVAGVTAAWWLLNAAITANPIGIIVVAVAGLIGGLVTLEEKTGLVSSTWNRVWSGMSGPIDSVKGYLSGFWSELQKLGSSLWDLFGPKLAEIWDGIKTGFQDAMDDIRPALQGLMDTLRPLFEQLKPILQAVGAALIGLGSIAADVLGGEMKPLFHFLGDAITAVINLVKGAIEFLTGVLQTLKGVFEIFFNFFKAIVGGIKGLFTGDFSMFHDAIRGLGNGFKDLFGGVINALQGLGHMVGAIWDAIYATFKAAIGIVIGVVKGFVTGIVDFFKWLWDVLVGHSIVPDMINGIINWFLSLPGRVLAMVSGFVQRVWDAFMDMTRKIAGTLAGFIQPFLNAWSGMWNGIKAAAEAVWNWLKAQWDNFIQGLKIIWDAVSGALRAAWDFVWGGIKTAAETIWNWLKSQWDNFIQGLKIIWDTVSGALRAAWDAVWNGIKAVAQAIWDGIRAAWDLLINGVRQAWDTWSSAFRAVWDALWNGVKSAAQAVWDGIRAAWDFLINGVRQAWDTWSAAFRQVWDTLWNGIKTAAETIWNALKAAWDTVIGAIRTAWDNFKAVFEGAWSTMWNGVKSVAEDIWGKIQTGWDNLSSGVQKTLEFLVGEVKRIWDQVTGIFKEPVNGVISIWNHVSGAFGLDNIPGLATGGEVNGPGTGTSDDIPVRLSNGEHVWTAAEVDAAGGHDAVKDLRQGILGGKRVLVGRGFPGDDNRMAAGGPATLPAAVSMAREKGDGRAYVYGGSGPDGFDCSGYMSAIYNALTGRPLWNRSFSTESNFEALGFIPGLSTQFTVGIMRGGGGPNSHMAGTLDGVNVESGGGHNSTRYGGPAAGSDHSQFPIKYSLGMAGGNFVTGGAGGGSAGPSAEQIRLHDEAVAGIRKIIDDTNVTTASKKFGVARAEGVPLRAFDTAGAKNQYGTFAPAGDTHGAGTQKDGLGAIAKLDAALAAASAGGGAVGGEIPTGDRLALINSALGLAHTPPPNTIEQWQAGLNTLISRESSWNPNAVNNWDSNASLGGTHGLMQLLHSNFKTYHAAGTSDNIYDGLANVAAGINYIKARHGDISNVQQANAGAAPLGYVAGTGNAAAGWSLVGENGPEMVKFRGGETVKSFDDIVTSLKSAATTEGKELATKFESQVRSLVTTMIEELKSGNTDLRATLETQIKTIVDGMRTDAIAASQRLSVSIEDALERLLQEAGIQMPVSFTLPPGGDPAQIAQQLSTQFLPQLEMMVRQHIGSK